MLWWNLRGESCISFNSLLSFYWWTQQVPHWLFFNLKPAVFLKPLIAVTKLGEIIHLMQPSRFQMDWLAEQGLNYHHRSETKWLTCNRLGRKVHSVISKEWLYRGFCLSAWRKQTFLFSLTIAHFLRSPCDPTHSASLLFHEFFQWQEIQLAWMKRYREEMDNKGTIQYG